MINVVLYEPEIPQNTGNIMRTCVASGCRLHLIEPLGFKIDDAHLKRSGVNYIDNCDYTVYEDYDDFLSKNTSIKTINQFNKMKFYFFKFFHKFICYWSTFKDNINHKLNYKENIHKDSIGRPYIMLRESKKQYLVKLETFKNYVHKWFWKTFEEV